MLTCSWVKKESILRVFLALLSLGRNGNLSHILYSQLNFAHKGIAPQGGKRFRYSPHFPEGLWLIWAPMDLYISSGQGCSVEAWTLTAQGVKYKARAADSEILLQPSNELGPKVRSHVAEMAWKGLKSCVMHVPSTPALRGCRGVAAPGVGWPH